MWCINIFFFLAVFLAIRQADPLALLLIIPAYWYLLNLISNMEELNGTDLPTESTRGYSRHTDHGLFDDTNNHVDTRETGQRTESLEQSKQ